MFFRISLIFSIFISVFLNISPTDAKEIRIIAKIKDNPTIIFRGISGSASATEETLSLIKACGWFELVQSDNADYLLTGTYSNGKIRFNLFSGNVPVGAWEIRSSATDARAASKLGLDAILKKLFNIDGICSTKIAFSAETAYGVRNIYLCDIDGKGVEQITAHNSLAVEPTWFPDGNSIAYTKYSKSSTDVVQTQLYPKRMVRRLSSFPGINIGVAVSPDAQTLALILSPDHMVDLYLKPINEDKLIRLTKGIEVEASPCWSPDGKKICFVSDASGRPRIYSVNTDGTNLTRLPSAGSEAVTPSWASNGQIAYATRIDGVYTIAVLDLESGRNFRATNAKGTWESPSWAPDNRHLVCKRSDGPRSSLFIIDTWTGKNRQLLATSENLSTPSWSKVRQ